jgi:hypothetical protein
MEVTLLVEITKACRLYRVGGLFACQWAVWQKFLWNFYARRQNNYWIPIF